MTDGIIIQTMYSSFMPLYSGKMMYKINLLIEMLPLWGSCLVISQ